MLRSRYVLNTKVNSGVNEDTHGHLIIRMGLQSTMEGVQISACTRKNAYGSIVAKGKNMFITQNQTNYIHV